MSVLGWGLSGGVSSTLEKSLCVYGVLEAKWCYHFHHLNYILCCTTLNVHFQSIRLFVRVL